MITGAAYVRVSTDQQLELSPDSQLNEIKKYAKANGIVLSNDSIFVEEEGRSGRKSVNRPQFQRMIAMAKTQPRPFDMILVWKFSRFARNQEESIVYKSMLKSKCNIDVISVSEPLADGPFGSLIERIIEWMDEYYSIRLSGEVTRGMTEKAKRGGVVASPAYGYQVINNQFVPVPEEAEVVQMVFEQFVNQNAKIRALAVTLNSLGVRTKKGRPIESRTVEYMLHNPVYIGKIRWSPNGHISRNYDKNDVILADGNHDPIVSLEIFERAQDKLKKRRKMYPAHAHEGTHVREYMLRGLVRCSNCGSTLIYAPGNGGLQCHAYTSGRCKASHFISLEKANSRILALIEKSFGEESFFLEHRQSASSVNEQRLIETQIQREQIKLKRVKAAYEDGVDTLEEYKINKMKIIESIAQLQAKKVVEPVKSEHPLHIFVKTHKNTVADLRSPETQEDAKNLILRSFVDHIIFDRVKNKFQIFFYG